MAHQNPRADAFLKAWAAAMLVVSSCLLSQTLGAPALQGRQPQSFMVIDLQRRASAQVRAAESLNSLLDGQQAGRISQEDLQDYALQRLKLIKDLSKDIETDYNVRQLDQMRRGRRQSKTSPPQPPESPDEARQLVARLTDLARQVKKQVGQIAKDSESYEVHVEELSQPQIKNLCRRIRKLTDILEDFFKEKR